jgi:hypothetical protein
VDHFIIVGEAHLRRILRAYAAYYNKIRTHRSLDKDAPVSRQSFEKTLRIMMATNHLGTPEASKVHPVVAATARELLNKSENERSGVLSTAVSFLGLYPVAVDIALRLESLFLSVLASSERLGHITSLATDLDAPVSRCQLSEGRHACALRLSCAQRVQREIKKNLHFANLEPSRPT